MAGEANREGDRWVVRFGKYQLRLGRRTVLAFGLTLLIIVVSFLLAPTNPDGSRNFVVAGLSTASAILGTLLGVVIQFEAIPINHAPTARAAVDALARISDRVEVTRTTVTQLSVQSSQNRIKDALVVVQDDLLLLGEELSSAMLQWDRVSSGTTDAVIVERNKGRETLKRMSREAGSD